MSRQDDACVELAVAVIERTLEDLRTGVKGSREDACEAVALGGLEHWISVVDAAYGMGDVVTEELRRLAGLDRGAGEGEISVERPRPSERPSVTLPSRVSANN